MDTKLLLIRIITLLFLESKNGSSSSSSNHLVKATLSFIKTPDASITTEFSRDSTTKLLEIVRWMNDQTIGFHFDRSDILTRVKMATETEEYIYEAFETSVLGDKTEGEVKDLIKTNRDQLDQFVTRSQIKNIIKEKYTTTHFKPDTVDWEHLSKDLINELEPYKNIGRQDKHQLVGSVSLNDVEGLAKQFESGAQQLSSDGVFRFGWQGLNRMLGYCGGARRGEMVTIGALQHNFKSGFALEMLKSAALYNKPYLFNPKKKPLLLRISLENSIVNDITHLYKSLIEPELETTIDVRSIDPLEAATYVNKRLSENGWHIRLEQYNPSEFTIFDLIDVIERYEDEGYEVCMVNIDYLAMMSTKGCKQGGATGQDIRDLYRRARNVGEA